MGGGILGIILPINVPKCHRRKDQVFLIGKHAKSSEFYYLEPDPYHSITDTVEALNTLIEEKHNHSESCKLVKVSRSTQKI